MLSPLQDKDQKSKVLFHVSLLCVKKERKKKQSEGGSQGHVII